MLPLRSMKELRKERGLSQEALASPLGLTRQMVSNFENGKSVPDIWQAKVIAQTLDYPVDRIIFGKEGSK